MLGTDRLLEEQRIEGSQRIAELDRLIRLENLRMRVKGKLEMRRAQLAQLPEIRPRLIAELTPSSLMQVMPVRAEFERSKPISLVKRYS